MMEELRLFSGVKQKKLVSHINWFILLLIIKSILIEKGV